MISSYFVEYYIKGPDYNSGSNTIRRSANKKSIISFIDVITSQNIEAFKKVVLKYALEHEDVKYSDTFSVEIINISFLGSK